jgi:phosphoribosylformimino-5-aminoimidazole carboxamide ribotide isomerase
MRIIAAIDLIGGKCVRLSQGDFKRQTSYNTDPLAIARELEDNGIGYLHLVDLDGAREGKIRNHGVLEILAQKTGMKIDFSGGIRSDDDIRRAFSYGASQVTCGSIAASSPDLFLKWLEEYGSDRIILGADFRNRKVATRGWMKTTTAEITEFLIKFRLQGVRYALCTDIKRDGMLAGPSVRIYKELVSVSGLNIIASGGISSTEDLRLLKKAGCEGAVIGKAILESRITFSELNDLC